MGHYTEPLKSSHRTDFLQSSPKSGRFEKETECIALTGVLVKVRDLSCEIGAYQQISLRSLNLQTPQAPFFSLEETV